MYHIKTLLSIVALFAIMLTACNKQPLYFSDSLKVYDSDAVNHSKELTGVPVIEEAIGAYSINVADTVICLANSKTEMLFSLYNLRGDSIASVGLRGKGPSDFTSNRMNKQYDAADDNTGIWVNDVNGAALKRLNLTKSIASGKSCVDSIIAIRPMVANAFLSDGMVIQEIMGDGNYDISATTVEGDTLFQETLYTHSVDPSELFTYYYSTMAVSPDRRYLVMAMLPINQINILDLQNGNKRSAVSVGGLKDPDYVLDRENNLPVWTYYSDLSLGDRYIYALYENQPYDTTGMEMNKSEIHVLDYNGNVAAIIPLDRFLYSISYSGNDNSIYGLDDNETVWKYQLPDID